MKGLDDLLGTLHEDSTGQLEDQLSLVEREIMRRRLVSAEIATTLFDRIRELNDEILLLLPEGSHSVDVRGEERRGLERERRLLERELRDELVGRWRDLQELRKEHRALLRERQGLEDRYRLFGDYAA